MAAKYSRHGNSNNNSRQEQSNAVLWETLTLDKQS
jgi:hypothetical protein